MTNIAPIPTRYNRLIAMRNSPIYLDYGATTPLDERAWEAMLPYFRDDFGNPASIHRYGQRAENALENARLSMAHGLGAKVEQIIFTSGATESDNLALRGAAIAAREKRGANHILISGMEHDAISQTAEQLAALHKFELEIVPPDKFGQISAEAVGDRLRESTAIVSIIMANNEVGTINPIAEIAEVCQTFNVPLHTDAVQAGAYFPIDVRNLGIDFLSLGAHKFYGPKGVGVLFVRDKDLLSPLQTGGSHESMMRAGTQNTAYIVGMAKAFEIICNEMEARASSLYAKRDRIIDQVLKTIPDSMLSGHPNERLPNNASFVFQHVDGNALLMHLDAAGFACSSGSACKTGNPEASQNLVSMGITNDWALGSLRVTIGIHTSDHELDLFLEALPKSVEAIRQLEVAR